MPKSVLIVGRSRSNSQRARRLFQSVPESSVCAEAEDGVDAISKAQQFSPDLVVLDLAMPVMNGLEAAGALRFILPNTTLFLLTAYKNRELELVTFQSGIRTLFSKYDNLDGLICRARAELKLEPRRETEPTPEAQKSSDFE